MAAYRVTDPEGKTWNISGEGSQEEALAHFQSQWKPAPKPAFLPGSPGDRFLRGAKAAVADPWTRLGRSYSGEDVYAPGEQGWQAESKRLGGAALDMAAGPLSVATLGSLGGLSALLKGGATIAGIGGGLDALHLPEGIQKSNEYLEGQVEQGNLNPGLGALLGTAVEVVPGMVPEAVAGLSARRPGRPAPPPEAPPVAPEPVPAAAAPEPAANHSPLADLLDAQGKPIVGPAPIEPVGAKWSAPKPKQPIQKTAEPVYGQPSKPLGLPEYDLAAEIRDNPALADFFKNDEGPLSSLIEPEEVTVSPSEEAIFNEKMAKKWGVTTEEAIARMAEEERVGQEEAQRQMLHEALVGAGGVSPRIHFIMRSGGIHPGLAGGEWSLESLGGDRRIVNRGAGARSPERVWEAAHEEGVIGPDEDLNTFQERVQDELAAREKFMHDNGGAGDIVYSGKQAGRGLGRQALDKLDAEVTRKGTRGQFSQGEEGIAVGAPAAKSPLKKKPIQQKPPQLPRYRSVSFKEANPDFKPVSGLDIGNSSEGLVGPDGGLPKTGQPMEVDVFHGRGRTDKSSIYAPGVDSPLIGKGKYSAFTEREASRFGPNVEKRTIQFKNPLVITGDSDLAAILGNPRQGPPRDLKGVQAGGQQIRKYALDNGHDGIVVSVPSLKDIQSNGQNTKIVKEWFGGSQAIELEP